MVLVVSTRCSVVMVLLLFYQFTLAEHQSQSLVICNRCNTLQQRFIRMLRNVTKTHATRGDIYNPPVAESVALLENDIIINPIGFQSPCSVNLCEICLVSVEGGPDAVL